MRRFQPQWDALDGLVFKIGDPEGDSVHPENGYNCFEGSMLVSTVVGLKPIRDINIGERIITSKGIFCVKDSWCNGIKDVYKIVIQNKSHMYTIYATKNHKIYTKEKGFIAMDKLNPLKEYTFMNSMVELFKANLIIDYCSHFITDVYDLSIDEKEEFFVNKILFHNCRCHSEPADDDYIQENDKTVSKGSDYLDAKDPETGNPYIPEQFRYNPGIQGAMPNDSSYFDVLSSANKGNAKLFEDDSNEKRTLHITSRNTLHHLSRFA